MAGYTYPTNPLPPSQDQTAYAGYAYPPTNPLPPNLPDNQWNQPSAYGQPPQPAAFPSYDQQNVYNSNPQFNRPAPDNSYGSFGGYNQQSQMKKNDSYGKGGNSNFRGNNPGNNRNSGQGFNKGPRGNYGAPSGMEEQHDTIFVSGISENTTEDELRDFFGSIGLIKMDKKTRKPKIWVYKDKETGRPKGEVTITYDDPPTATSAINWFNGKELNGAILKVELAQRKNNFLANKNNNNRNNNGGDRGDRGNRGGGNRDFDKSTNNDRGGNTQSREGDWKCTNCMNNNFAWRNSCNRCKTEKSADSGSSNNGGDRRNNNLPYERRDNNRSFGGGQRNNGGGNRNQDRGGFSNRNSGGRDQRGGRNGPMRSSDNRRSGPY